MRRLLFVSPVHPHPLDRGQNVRIQEELRACRRDHEVTLVVPRPEPGVSLVEVERLADRVVYAEAPTEPASWRHVLSFARRHRRLRRPEVVGQLAAFEAVLDQVHPGLFDLVWLERTMLTVLLRAGRDRLVVDLDDLEYRKSWRAATSRSSQFSWGARLQHLYYAGRFLLPEALGTRGARAAVVASPTDAAHLARLTRRIVTVVPNGVDVPARRPPRPGVRSGRAVFLGNLAYSANTDALELLRDEVLPTLRREGWPGTVHVIGGGATPKLREAHPEAVFHGYVDDLAAALREFDVLLAPLRLGGGTKLKVLDAMGQGLPVVTTPVGAEGLGLEDGVSALIGRNAEQLAHAVLRLERDPDLPDKLAAQAFAQAQRMSWQRVRQDLADRLVDWEVAAQEPRLRRSSSWR